MSKTLHSSSRPFALIDSLAAKWAPAIVPIFMSDPKSSHKLSGRGTGFIVERSDTSYWLITANHVLSDIPKGEVIIANISGSSILLNELEIHTRKDEDLAAILITNEIALQNGIHKLIPIPLKLSGEIWESTELNILMGYPGARNKLNLNIGKLNKTIISYTCCGPLKTCSAKTHIKNPVAFEFDKRSAINSNEEKTPVGLFNGNSGGPILQIYIERNSHITNYNVALSGVFLGWDKSTREMFAAKTTSLQSFLGD